MRRQLLLESLPLAGGGEGRGGRRLPLKSSGTLLHTPSTLPSVRGEDNNQERERTPTHKKTGVHHGTPAILGVITPYQDILQSFA